MSARGRRRRMQRRSGSISVPQKDGRSCLARSTGVNGSLPVGRKAGRNTSTTMQQQGRHHQNARNSAVPFRNQYNRSQPSNRPDCSPSVTTHHEWKKATKSGRKSVSDPPRRVAKTKDSLQSCNEEMWMTDFLRPSRRPAEDEDDRLVMPATRRRKN